MEPLLPQPPRRHLNGPALADLLGQLGLVDPPGAPPPLVEGLAGWLGWKQSIPLAAALQGAAPVAGAVPPQAARMADAVPPQAARMAEQRVQHVHQALGAAIADDSSTAREDGASFVPFRQRYASLQQAMETAIHPVRAQLRALLARHPAPALRRLAALDAVMAQALAAREQALLTLMPVLLEKHFSRLRQGAAAAAADCTNSATTSAAVTNGKGNGNPTPTNAAWLPVFRHDMQRLLGAECDLRLQPVQGLLLALQPPPAQPQLS